MMNRAIEESTHKLENLTISPPSTISGATVEDLLTETLRQIFVLLVGTPGARSTLGRVCRRWHQIVLSTFEFWAVIRLHESSEILEIDPDLWARQARIAIQTSSTSQGSEESCPLSVVWEISIRNLNAQAIAFRRFIEVAPYSMWRELRVLTPRATSEVLPSGDTRDIKLVGTLRPMNCSIADFTNLELLEIERGALLNSDTNSLLFAIAKTANQLRSFKVAGIPRNSERVQDDLDKILSRVSDLHTDWGLDPMRYLFGVPKNITRLYLPNYNHGNWNFGYVVNLEIGTLTMFRTTRLEFPNVTSLHIGHLQVNSHSFLSSGTSPQHSGGMDLPHLRDFRVGMKSLNNLQYISAPQLQIIQFIEKVDPNTSLPSDYLKPDGSTTLPCLSVSFDAGIQAEDLSAGLSWFSKVERLSASLIFNTPNTSLLYLKSDLQAHTRGKDSENCLVKIFTYAPNLAFLHVKLPKFEDDYNQGLELAVAILTTRRRSGLQSVDIRWDDKRELHLTTDDV